MQLIRSTAWRLLGLAFLALLVAAVVFPDVLGGERVAVPQSALWWTAAAWAVGMSVKPLFVQTTETLTHEVGHALVGSMLGSRVARIAVRRDTSGVTQSKRALGRFRSALISAAGPLATPTFFVFTALMVTSNVAHIWILFVLVGVVLVTVTTVRNVWGWIVGIVAVAILWQVVRSSLAFGGDPASMSLPAIWASSPVNAAVTLTGFNAGIALRYSWRCREAPQPNMDEYKFGRALGIGPKLGGFVILLSNAALTGAAFGVLKS